MREYRLWAKQSQKNKFTYPWIWKLLFRTTLLINPEHRESWRPFYSYLWCGSYFTEGTSRKRRVMVQINSYLPHTTAERCFPRFSFQKAPAGTDGAYCLIMNLRCCDWFNQIKEKMLCPLSPSPFLAKKHRHSHQLFFLFFPSLQPTTCKVLLVFHINLYLGIFASNSYLCTQPLHFSLK